MKATLLACSLLASVITAHSATLVVRTTSDASTDSLRQKILEANPAGGDTIVFAIPTSSPGYDSTTGVFTIGLTSGELVIDKNVRIDGSAQKISIRRTGGSQFRIFRITAGTVATLNDLAISNGYGSAAAGVWNFGGDLTLRNCTLYDNIVPLDAAQGGAISTSGTLRVSNCTFTANSAIEGTAIYGTGSITIDNTTIFGNGSGNSAVNPAGAATVRVRNTIIAGNLVGEGNVKGTFISEGYNLIGSQAAGTTGFGAMGDQLGVTAAQVNLGPLQDNGGNTPTRRPLAGSLAIDQGNRGVNANSQPIDTDQRGSPRPIDLAGIPNAAGGDGSDIGAVETGALQTGPSFTVTNAHEHNSGGCTADDCTLLEAVNAAESDPDASIINFAPTVTGTITNVLTPNGFTLTTPVTINGPGARYLTISGGSSSRIFATYGTVAISGLTLADGRRDNSDGAGIFVGGGSLTLTDCAIRNCFALGTPGGNGGGLYNVGTGSVVLTRCTFYNNFASQFGGGAICNLGILTANNCTFTGNQAPAGGAILALANNANSRNTLRNCTITANAATATGSATAGGGGYYGEGAVGNSLHHFSNTIIAGNANANNPDLRGFGTTEGNNLIGNLGQGGSGFTNGVNGDKVGVAPAFASFANNGGPTDTWALSASSPAINMGNNNLAPVTDQRGFGRNGISDIGAFEFNGPPPPTQLVSAVSRKTHGNSGTFDINLALAGIPTVECRSGGMNGNYTVIFTFTNNVAGVGSAAVTTGAGFVSSSETAADARQYVVNLSGITNAQRVTVTLFNVTDSFGYNSSSIPLTLGILIGDTNGNNAVTATDIGQVKSQSGQPVTASNFRADVTASGGSINASDIGLVKSASGTQLP